MINLAQVVAALATGALLAIAFTLLFRLNSLRREVERLEQPQHGNDRELEIEAAAQLIEESFDLFQQATDRDEEGNRLPHGAVAVVRKGHLRMLVFGGLAAPLAGVGEWLGKLWRHHRRNLTGQVLTGAAVVTAATLLFTTPWHSNGRSDPAPPSATESPTTSMSASPVNTPGPTVTITPTDSRPPSRESSTAILADGAPGSASPAPSASLTEITEGHGAGESPTASTRPSPTATQPGDSETTMAPSPGQSGGGSGLCLDVTVPPLLDVDVCLLGGG